MPTLKSSDDSTSESLPGKEVILPGRIWLEKGVTQNLGDYNSGRLTVGIEVPCDTTNDKAVKRGFRRLNEIVDDLIEREVNDSKL